jgi:hypothetical protein
MSKRKPTLFRVDSDLLAIAHVEIVIRNVTQTGSHRDRLSGCEVLGHCNLPEPSKGNCLRKTEACSGIPLQSFYEPQWMNWLCQ